MDKVRLIAICGVFIILFAIVLFVGFGKNVSTEFQGVAEIAGSIAGYVFNAATVGSSHE